MCGHPLIAVSVPHCADSGDHHVEPGEFIEGLKRMALDGPLDEECFPSLPTSHHECVQRLNQSANRKIQVRW